MKRYLIDKLASKLACVCIKLAQHVFEHLGWIIQNQNPTLKSAHAFEKAHK
jgi:hypothetical protein